MATPTGIFWMKPGVAKRFLNSECYPFQMNLLTANPGGIEFLIGDIPAAIVNNHQEAFYYWEKARIRDATLFHVDAHSDMVDAVQEYLLKHLCQIYETGK